MRNSLFVLLFFIGILTIPSGCGSSQGATRRSKTSNSISESRPDWVTNRPIDSRYYIGIAVASKSANPTSYALVAQRNALSEMASEIDVRVKSNSMLFTFEETHKYHDEFKEFIQVKANQKLENFEQVAAWENTSEYWVYYRLSKEQFQKDKQAKIDKATSLALQFISQGEDEEGKRNYKSAMISYFDALIPIKPYVGEPLQAMYHGEQIYLGNYLFDKISRLTHDFEINPVQPDLTTIWGRSITPSELSFTTLDSEGNIMQGIPVAFSYSEGIIRPRDDLSSAEGKVYTEIKKVTSTVNVQEVTAVIDFESMVLGNTRPDEIMALILKELYQPTTTIKIHVSAPSIYVVSTEKSFGKGKGSNLKKAFIAKSIEMGFKIASSKSNADLLVVISTDTKQAGVTYDLHNVYLNGSVEVRDNKTKVIVYQDVISSIKGVSTTYKGASIAAYNKSADMISSKIAPRFFRKYTR